MSDQTKADALSDDAQRVLLCVSDREKAGQYTGCHNVALELGWETQRVADAIVELVDGSFIGGGAVS